MTTVMGIAAGFFDRFHLGITPTFSIGNAMAK